MSQMIIKIVAVEVGNAVTKTNKDYKFLEVTYKNVSFDNKVELKKILPFGSKEVFATLESAKPGTVFTILREKDKDGYWQWIGIAVGETKLETTMAADNPKPAQAATATPKSTFETAEERAKRQMLIVRQSSLTSAIAFLNHNNKNYVLNDVINLADTFYNYVFDLGLTAKVTIPELEEDIPM